MTFPAGFDKCVREGGRVRTIKPKEGEYLHVCYDKAGKSHSGEVKTSKKEASEISAFLRNQGYVEKDGEFVKGSEMKLRMLIPQIELASVFSSSKPTSEIEIMASGKWEHPQYGDVQITEADIDKFIASFDDKVRKVDIAVDQEHMPEKGAAGWYKSMKKVFEDGKTKLKATIEWTKLGTQLIQDGIFKYFSPEFDFAYEDQETHEQYENVLLGGALTNRPYFKSLAPVALSENMFAGFTGKTTVKGGENNMTKDELKAKLVEDSAFALADDASEEEKKSLEEAKAELAKEAEDKAAAEKADVEAKEKAKKEEELKKAEDLKKKKMSEQFISQAEHTKEMNELKSKMGIMESKLRFKEVTEQVQGFVFSESNPSGVLLPKNKKAAVDLLMAATPKVAELFSEFLKGLPAVSAKLFKEEGGDGEGATKETQKKEAIDKKMSENKGLTYGEAVKLVSREQPALFK